MTERLFEENSYIKSFEARVEAVTENGLVLDRTGFFPEGGGQTSDVGFMNGIRVTDVTEKDGVIYHKLTDMSPFSTGLEVTGEIDFQKHFSDMQQHTGEHIVSGLIHTLFGFDNVGFHLGKTEVTLDFNGSFTEEEIKATELRANKAIWENRDVRVFFPDENERERISYRSKKEIDGRLRLVEIDGIDLCACCAPHVRKTGEIGIIKIVNYERHRGGTRIYILCGERALRDYGIKQEQNKTVGNLLKVREYETADGVRDVLERKNRAEYELNRAVNSLAVKSADECEKADVIAAVSPFTGQSLTYFGNAVLERAEKIAAVFGKTEADGYQYMLLGKNTDVREITKQMNTALNGRGGGKPFYTQGSVKCTENEIRDFFRESLKTEVLYEIQ